MASYCNPALNSFCMIMIIVVYGCVSVKALSYTITCDRDRQNGCQNETLGSILNSVEGEYDVHIDIRTDHLQLKEMINITGINSLTIIGKLDVQTNIICVPNQNASAGVILTNINGSVELGNLNLTLCGSKVNNGFDNKTYISALTIIECRNVQLTGISIERSGGIGLMIVNHLGGEVNIESAIFKENVLHRNYSSRSVSDSPQVFGGGGVYVVIHKNNNNISEYNLLLHFHNCTFENNTANTSRYDHLYTDVHGKGSVGYGRGGGVYVVFDSNVRNVGVLFSGCTFTNNQAFLGSGLAVQIQGGISEITEGIQVTIADTVFKRNGCDESTKQGFGGGAHLTFDSYWTTSHNIKNCSYSLENVSFLENCAKLGGGVHHISGKRRNDHSSVTFHSCSFEDNKAYMGSAIFLAPSIDRRISTGFSTLIKFSNCSFARNAVFDTKNLLLQINPGAGTVYISSYHVVFNGHTNFTKNNGSALYVINGVVNFQNSGALFLNNTALQGGAIALIGSSVVILGSQRRYDFVNNSAIYKGGAIYVSQINNVDFFSSELCFIQCVDENNLITFRDWNTTILFTGNRAKDAMAGHTVYATSLHSCQQVYDFTTTGPVHYELVNATEVFNVRGIKIDEGSLDSEIQIATDGAVLHGNKSTPLAIIPGEGYKHSVTVTDDLNQTINASFWASFFPKIGGEAIDISLASNSSTVITDKFNIRGKPNQKAIIFMNLISARQTFIQLDMEVMDCPPGFELKDQSQCICNTNAHVGMFDCDLEKFRSHLISGYWAGYINDSWNTPKLVTSICPFCDYSLSESSAEHSDIILPRNRSKLDKAVCGDTRTGIVCGKCEDGYTVHLHSPGFLCKPAEPLGCRLGWLFYILSELVPVTVVFITVLVLNINFTSGAVNGFILFSQLLVSFDLTGGGIISFPRQSLRNASQGYQIFYGFFNLEYFNSESLSFCLWKGASALDMLAMKYITILYTALLIITLVWTMNKCGGRCLGKCCRITTIKTSVVHGISSFLMIGYSQCVNVSLSLLLQVHIYAAQDENFRPPNRVWLNGEVVHFSKEHLPYALPAVLCLLTVGIIPPILLLTYPLLNKVIAKLDLEKFTVFAYVMKAPSISSIKPFLDSFQGCFKDDMRFFAGLYFLYRWMFLLIHIGTVGFFEHYTVVGGVLVFILTLHTVCQPYLKRAHNIIDALLLCNLLLINFLSLLNFHRSNNPKIPNSTIIRSGAMQTVLIYIPALIMTVFIFVYFLKYICGCCFGNRKPSFFIPVRARKLRDLVRTISSLNESSDEDLTHDQLMDEDVEFRAVCDYVEDRDYPEDTYN